MLKPLHALGFAAVVALIMSFPTISYSYTGQELAPQAKVSLQQARAIALKTVPGTVTDQELEKEPGGTGLRYSFDIKAGAKTFEVGVDAQTGAVLERKVEGPNPD
jgi:uncharacterized membrane protein YkoI